MQPANDATAPMGPFLESPASHGAGGPLDPPPAPGRRTLPNLDLSPAFDRSIVGQCLTSDESRFLRAEALAEGTPDEIAEWKRGSPFSRRPAHPGPNGPPPAIAAVPTGLPGDPSEVYTPLLPSPHRLDFAHRGSPPTPVETALMGRLMGGDGSTNNPGQPASAAVGVVALPPSSPMTQLSKRKLARHSLGEPSASHVAKKSRVNGGRGARRVHSPVFETLDFETLELPADDGACVTSSMLHLNVAVMSATHDKQKSPVFMRKVEALFLQPPPAEPVKQVTAALNEPAAEPSFLEGEIARAKALIQMPVVPRFMHASMSTDASWYMYTNLGCIEL